MTPRGPDGKFTPSTPQQKLAAHVERVNAAHPGGQTWTQEAAKAKASFDAFESPLSKHDRRMHEAGSHAQNMAQAQCQANLPQNPQGQPAAYPAQQGSQPLFKDRREQAVHEAALEQQARQSSQTIPDRYAQNAAPATPARHVNNDPVSQLIRANVAAGRNAFTGAFRDEEPFRATKTKPNPSHKDAFLWLGYLAAVTLVVLGWYLLAH